MTNYMWYFKDLEDGSICLFSTEEKANEAIKKYGCHFYDEHGIFPEEDEDYILRKIRIDPDIDAIFNDQR